MLVTLAAAGYFLLQSRHTYPTDVATAGASWSPGEHQDASEERVTPAPGRPLQQ
jgi:hypothetical protein